MRVKDYQSGYDIKELISKMKTPKSEPITIGPPILGLNFRLKPSEIKDNETPYCKNARITRNYIESRPGITLIAEDFDANIMYIREFVTSAGVTYLIIITEKSLYYSTNLTTFTRLPYYVGITDTDFGGDTDNAFWGVTIADYDYFCFSQGIDPVLYVNVNMDQVRRLSTDCPAATFGILYADRLVIAGLTNLPFRLKYSVRGTYTDWTGTGSGFKDWVEDPQGVAGLSAFGGVLVVYKTYSISHMSETGRSDSPFDYKTKIPGIGLYFPGIFFSIGDADVIGGSDNFYSYNTVNIKALADDVKDRFLQIVDPNYSHKAHSLVIEEFGEAQNFFPSIDNTTPNKCWIYNYEMDIWSSEWDLAATASGYATQEISESWNTTEGVWDTDTDIWNSAQLLASVPLNMIAQGTSLYKEDTNALDDAGTNFTFEWWTKEFKLPEARTITTYRVVVDYYCAVQSTLKCSLSGDGGQTFTDEVSIALTYSSATKMKRAFFDFIETFETVLARFRCTDGGRFQIVKVAIESMPTGDIIA